jgi:cell division protein FtsW (lipid II flippase)
LFSFLTLALVQLWLAGIAPSIWRLLGSLGVFTFSMVTVHLTLARAAPHADCLLAPLVLCLSGLGLVLVERLAPALFWKQAMWLAAGSVIMLLIAVVPRDLRWLRRYRYSWLAMGLILLASSLILGVNPLGRGARLWLGLGGLYFQPSEFLKIVLIVFLASYLAEKQELIRLSYSSIGRFRAPSLPYLAPLVLVWGVTLILLAAQQDLGAGTLLFGTVLAMLYVASRQIAYVYGGILLLAFGGAVAQSVSQFVALRVNVWLHPWALAGGGGYQIVQSLLSLAAGGVLGTGLGRGLSARYIPVVHTDFVFAAIGEELGLCGALAVLIIYTLLLYRGLRIALLATSAFDRLLASGLSVGIAFQAWVITGGNLKILPLTGVTLPFVSYGGSSLIASYIAIGLLLHISAHSPPATPEQEQRASSASLTGLDERDHLVVTPRTPHDV